MVDFDVIQKLIKIVEESDITGLCVEEGGMRVEVRREKGEVVASQTSPSASLSAPSGNSVTEYASSSSSASDNGKLPQNIVPVVSPMVGTFYRSPSPDSKAFVEIGDRIESGKPVCIIEAMKLFNQIEAETSGKIAQILVENGQPVEYGQKLMLIDKEG